MIKYNANNKYSEVISVKDIESWKSNVIFEGGTGTGKTRFILEVLSKYALNNDKSILFLCNRNALYNEVTNEISLLGISNIDVMTYQYIEDKLRKKEPIFILPDYIVCDEFHHVLEIYNIYTDLSYKWIMEQPSKKIFMSATCSTIFNSFVEKGIVSSKNHYCIPKDYSYVNDLFFFSNKRTHIDIIKDKLNNANDKIIYFANSIKGAIKVYEMFNDYACFYCSKNTKDILAKEYLNLNLHCISNNTFTSRLLVTTKALDVGITLLDRSIKHIITDIFDISSLVQCLGRKRTVDKTDTCNFYIRKYSKRELNLFRKDKELKPIKLFKKDKEEFNKIYGSDREFHSNYIYFNEESGEYTYNKLAYLKLICDNKDIDKMTKTQWINKEGEIVEGIGHKNFVLNNLGDSIQNVIDMDDVTNESNKDKLIRYLESVVGEVMLTKEDRVLLIQTMNVKQNGKLLKSINSLNAALDENDLNYCIKEFSTSRIVNGKKKNYKSAWKVLRLTE